MTKLSLENWKTDDNLDGLLFFAQIIEEMASRYTLDTYKAPVFNSHSLCDEIIDVSEEIGQGFLHEKGIIPIKEELIWNLQNDPVAKHILGYRYHSIIDELKESDNQKRLIAIVRPIQNLLEKKYFAELKNQIIATIKNPKDKEAILNLSKIYISELLFYGYSQEFLHQMIMQSFFSTQKITSITQIEQFLNKFTFEKKSYDVYFKGDNKFYYLNELSSIFNFEISDEAITPRKGRSEEKDFFKIYPEYPLNIIFKNFEALDPFDAKIGCELLLINLKDLGAFSTHKEKLNWFYQALIYSENDFVTIVGNYSPMFKIKDLDIDNFKVNIDEDISFFVNFNNTSRYFIMNSFNLHSIAIDSKNSVNQLLNLWTALETLLPPPPNNDIRIVHFLCSHEPFLARKYIQKLIFDLLNELRYELGDQLTQIFFKIPHGSTDFEKISFILCQKEESEKFRDEIYAKIGRNLRLRYKIFNLMKKLHNSDALLDTIQTHNKRVSWQLQRIYRARNLIVHKGGKLPYIDHLVENLHSYYHAIISLIKEIQSEYDNIDSLETVFKLIRIEYESHVKLLKSSKGENCSSDNFKMMLFCNPK